jgi:hypothetical protein
VRGKKWREAATAVPATVPGFFGGGPWQNRLTLPQGRAWSTTKANAFRFREHQRPFHLAAIELTSIVSSVKTPVTVAILPACLSSVAKTDWSLVFKM